MNTLRVESVARKLDVSRGTVWRYTRSLEGFPQPFKLGPRTTVWSEQAIEDFLITRMQGVCNET